MFEAKPYCDIEARQNAAVALVISRLPATAPFWTPGVIAPALGLTRDALYKHCQGCKALRTWRGSYRFFLDDPGHVDALKALIKFVLWGARSLPAELKLTHPAPRRVQ